MTHQRDPWERTPRETDKVWAYFVAFRDMAYPQGISGTFHARDLSALAKDFGFTADYARCLSATHNWFERTGAYDRHVDAKQREAGLSAIQRLAIKHERITSKALAIAEKELDKLAARADNPEGLAALAPRELLALLEWTVKQQRLMTGQGTGDGEPGSKPLDLNKLGTDDLEALLEMHKKANAIDTTGE